LRVGDGIDESCQAKDLCTSSPYAAGGGDPVNVPVDAREEEIVFRANEAKIIR
jgi:hypothetical protein